MPATKTVRQKLSRLGAILHEMGGVAVAFSGGVDSTLLGRVAVEQLADRALLVTATSPSFTKRELEFCRKLAGEWNARHQVLESQEFRIPGYVRNDAERCYVCKKDRFENIFIVAAQNALPYVADGANVDDACVFRPGERACEELGVRHPLREAGFTKADVRAASRHMNLPNWDAPSLSCLSTRVPYGTELDPAVLARIEKAEEILRQAGMRQMRVRDYGDTARIEVPPGRIAALARATVRTAVVDAFKNLGYHYVTLDLQGYRSGSLDEVHEHAAPSEHKKSETQ